MNIFMHEGFNSIIFYFGGWLVCSRGIMRTRALGIFKLKCFPKDCLAWHSSFVWEMQTQFVNLSPPASCCLSSQPDSFLHLPNCSLSRDPSGPQSASASELTSWRLASFPGVRHKGWIRSHSFRLRDSRPHRVRPWTSCFSFSLLHTSLFFWTAYLLILIFHFQSCPYSEYVVFIGSQREA